MMEFWIILGSMLAACIIAAVIGIVLESIRFNKGVCPHCKTKMEFFDTDSWAVEDISARIVVGLYGCHIILLISGGRSNVLV